MNAKLNIFDPAISAIQRALEPRRYAAEPAADFAVSNFRRQCERDAAVRDELERGDYADPMDDPMEGMDAEDFFSAQQCPSDATFR